MIFYSLDGLKEHIANRRTDGARWAAIAKEFDVNVAIIWRIMNESYEPKQPAIRNKLGLPEIIQQRVIRNERGRFSKDPEEQAHD